MDLYTLDYKLRRETLIDSYISLIWTERYSDVGEFELIFPYRAAYRQELTTDTFVVILESKRIMVIDTVDSSFSDSGEKVTKVTGQSLEAWFKKRAALRAIAASGDDNTWTLTGTPGWIAREIFRQVCVVGSLSLYDKLPFYQAGSLYPANTIPEDAPEITVVFQPTTVFDAIKKMCDLANLGFRITRNGEKSELYFDIYSGDDRTSSQKSLEPVIFSESLDNLTDVTQISTVADFYNMAYVVSPNGAAIVAGDYTEVTVSGFKRNVLYVDASDINLPAGFDLDNALRQRGFEELAKHRALIGFDGEIPKLTDLVYDKDYRLGDLVEFQSEDESGSRMRVTEQIFISDAQGERAYPTLTVNQILTPGSWLAWSTSQEWDEELRYWDEI